MELSFLFRPFAGRRIPDPNFKKTLGAERHLFLMPVSGLPAGLPFDPNARRPNIRKRVYSDVLKSLKNEDGEPGTFHLKNKGITIIAESVRSRGEDEYTVKLRKGVHGIVDGGHTYKLIRDNVDALPDNQYVLVEVRVGIPDKWVPEIAGGLNTSVQVQDMSLDNLAGDFDWLKRIISHENYHDRIAWSENDPGEFDARDLIALLMAFNIDLYPNDHDDHPVSAYEKKSMALKAFDENPRSFKALKPIVKDILVLHDTIAKEARDIWNNETSGNGGALAFMEKRKSGTWEFIFSGETSEYRLYDGALYPMLAAFRWHLKKNTRTGLVSWRGGFASVVAAWRSVATELVRATLNQSNELGRNPNAIGKSRNHWANLHARVAKFDLIARQKVAA